VALFGLVIARGLPGWAVVRWLFNFSERRRDRVRADEYRSIQSALGTRLDAIQKELKNAKPLPADCRPYVGRVRMLSNAVDAAKQAAAAR